MYFTNLQINLSIKSLGLPLNYLYQIRLIITCRLNIKKTKLNNLH